MTETKLKPCPFCGGKPDLGSYSSSGNWIVVCSKCEAETQIYETEQKAVKAWNTRHIEDDNVNYESTSYSCRSCKNSTEDEIKRLREENKKYEDVLVEIAFCCGAIDCSLEQQSEALKAIDEIIRENFCYEETNEDNNIFKRKTP